MLTPQSTCETAAAAYSCTTFRQRKYCTDDKSNVLPGSKVELEKQSKCFNISHKNLFLLYTMDLYSDILFFL